MCGQTMTNDRNFRRNLRERDNVLRGEKSNKKIKEMERKDHLRIIKVIFIHDATFIAFP